MSHPSEYPSQIEQEDEIDVHDIALVLIENLRLLLLGPLLAAAAVGAGLWAWPSSYQSEAVQTGDLLLVAMYNSAGVQDAVAQKLFSQLQAQDPDAARKKVVQAI